MIDYNKLDYSNIKSSDFPTESTRMVADCCGAKAAVKIIERFGGMPMNIPTNISRKGLGSLYANLVSEIGEKKAKIMVDIFSGEALLIPARREALRLVISQLEINGDMMRHITHRYGISRSTVYRMKKLSQSKCD